MEADGGGASKIRSLNFDRGPHFAGRRECLHECAKSCIQAKDSAELICPASKRCSVQLSTGRLDDPGDFAASVTALALSAKAKQRGERTLRRNLEDCALKVGPAGVCRAIKVSVCALKQPRVGAVAVGAAALGAETVQGCQRTLGSDFEDGAIERPGITAIKRCPIKIAVSGLNQCCIWIFPVRAVCLGAKAMQRGYHALLGDLEDNTTAVGPAIARCPVQVAVRALHKSGLRMPTIHTDSLSTKTV